MTGRRNRSFILLSQSDEVKSTLHPCEPMTTAMPSAEEKGVVAASWNSYNSYATSTLFGEG